MPSNSTSASALPTRPLGNSDLNITAIGFGAWAIGGGDWQFGWGAQEDDDSIAAIHRALELGINWIDTAAVYGLGHSEEVVARALADWSGPQPLVFTKCSMRWGREGSHDRKIYRSLNRTSLREELEGSLRRLKRDTIDLYQIHWADPDPEIEEGWETLQEFKREGKIRYAGVSNFSVAQLERIRPLGQITSLQPPYSLVRPETERELLPYCEQHNVGVIAYSPMASGLLTGKMTRERVEKMPEDDFRKNSPRFQGAALDRNLRLAAFLGELGKPHGRSAGEVAIAWTLRKPAVTAAIVGARDARQVDGIIGAATFRLNDSELKQLDDFLQSNPE
jgi:aryl-alcohol dehydrogenase-like predicted oxidoreductase